MRSGGCGIGQWLRSGLKGLVASGISVSVWVCGGWLLSLPPVHAAETAGPPPLEAYGELPAISSLSLSPQGDRLAYFGIANSAPVLVAVGVDGKSLGAWQLGDLKLREIRWIGQDRLQVTASDHLEMGWTGYEIGRDIVIDLNKGSVKPLLSTRTTVGNTLRHYGNRFIDGHWYSYVGVQFLGTSDSGHKEMRGVSLARVDLETMEIEKLATANDRFSNWLIAPDGHIVANSQFSDSSGIWHLYAGEGIEPELVRLKDPTQSSFISGLGRNGDTLLYSTTLDGEGKRYFEVPLKADAGTIPASTQLFKDIGRSVGIAYDRTSRTMEGYWIHGDFSELVLLDPQRQAQLVAIRKAFSPRTIEFIEWSNGGRQYIVQSHGAQDTGTYWFVDAGANKVVKLGDEFPRVPPAWIGEVRSIQYKAADGLSLQAVLTLPPKREARALPLIVMPHGGPESRDTPRFNWVAQAFASRGYAVLQPNFRGSSDVSVGLKEAGFGELGRKMQTDLSDGVAELARLGIVDPARVCIFGGSYGGYAALAGVTLQHGIYRCAVSLAGLSDIRMPFEEAAERHDDVTLRYWSRYAGTRNPRDDRLGEASPLEHAANADAPILLIHGRKDVVVPIEHSEKMLKALKRADKPVEFVELEGEDHWLSRNATRVAMLKAALAFVEKYNPPGAAAPSSPP